MFYEYETNKQLLQRSLDSKKFGDSPINMITSAYFASYYPLANDLRGGGGVSQYWSELSGLNASDVEKQSKSCCYYVSQMVKITFGNDDVTFVVKAQTALRKVIAQKLPDQLLKLPVILLLLVISGGRVGVFQYWSELSEL